MQPTEPVLPGGGSGGAQPAGPPPVADGVARRLQTLAFGADAATRRRVTYALVPAFVHLVWALLYANAARTGGMAPEAAGLMVAIKAVAIAGFFAWARWSPVARAKGNSIAGQMLFAIASAVLGYALAPALRPALLQALCLTQLFGFFQMRPKQLALAGGFAIGLLMLAVAFGSLGALPAFDVRREVYPALSSCCVLALLTSVTVRHSRRREALVSQRMELDAAVATVGERVLRDTLTGLVNRRRMMELLQIEHDRAVHTGQTFTVTMIDLDHFKRINDQHGHGRGDAVLQGFAQVAGQAVRATDTLARWGGEEFLLLMPETEADAIAIAPVQRLREAMADPAMAPLLSEMGVTFSAGVAAHRHPRTVEQTLAAADRALYAAKAAGRNRSVVEPGPTAAAPGPQTPVPDRLPERARSQT